MPTVMIGLDGADLELVEKWREDLPNFKAIMNNGFHGELESIKPPITVPAWMCMLSGKKPGEFEAWDFGNLDFENYEITPVNSSFFKNKSIIDSDKKTISFRVPGTTPGYEINGDMISGFMKAEEIDFQSKELESEAKNQIDFDFKDLEEGTKREVSYHNFEENVKIFKWLLENRQFDRAFSVFRIIDTYMHAVDEESEMKEAYLKADEALGKFRVLCKDNNWNLIVTSDHGSGNTRKKLYLNAWLREKGYTTYEESEEDFSKTMIDRAVQIGLKLGLKPLMKKTKNLIESNTGKNLQPDKSGIMDGMKFPETQAFSNLSAVSNFGAIWIHDAKRFPEGIIENGSDKAKEIKKQLEAEEYIKQVYHAEELGFTEKMPDLIVEADKNMVIGGELYTNKFHNTSAVVHNKEGLWMGEGPAFTSKNQDAHLRDVAATVQAIEGQVSVNSGKVREDILKDTNYSEGEDLAELDL